jgi:hypothetical protein
MYLNKIEHSINEAFKHMSCAERECKILEIQKELERETDAAKRQPIHELFLAAKSVHSDLCAVQREAIASHARPSWTASEPLNNTHAQPPATVVFTPRLILQLSILAGAVFLALCIAEFLRWLWASGIVVYIGGAAVGIFMLLVGVYGISSLNKASDPSHTETETHAESRTETPRIIVTQTTEIF